MSVLSLKRFNQINFRNFFKLRNNSKIYIYPNLNGIGLSFFVFFCFLISVFYENNSGLLLSIIIFFIFFISILISHQNINNLKISSLNEYYVEANKNKSLTFIIENLSKEKKLNININYQKQNIGNYNFSQKIKERKNIITVKDEIYKYVVSIEQRIQSLDQKIYVSARCLKQIIDLARGWAIINNKDYVTHQDIKDTIPYILRHRIKFLNQQDKLGYVNKEILEKINIG